MYKTSVVNEWPKENYMLDILVLERILYIKLRNLNFDIEIKDLKNLIAAWNFTDAWGLQYFGYLFEYKGRFYYMGYRDNGSGTFLEIYDRMPSLSGLDKISLYNVNKWIEFPEFPNDNWNVCLSCMSSRMNV